MREKYVIIALAGLLSLTAAAVMLIPRTPVGTVYAWQGDVAFFERNGRMGLIDRRGEVLYPPA